MTRYARNTITLIFLFRFLVLVWSELPPNQTNTMTRLYQLIQNDTDSFFPWSNVRNDSNPCSWKGVSCNPNNSSVVKLSVSEFWISSPQILPLFCEIDTLESLDVSNNHFSLIPVDFITSCRGITGLKLLNFTRNRLAGPLPSFHGFGMLEHLDMSHNSLSGNISLQLSELAFLKSLNLSYNYFRGPVPTNPGSSNLIEELQLCCNHFQGEIPAELVGYGNLSLIDLSVNNISGSVPHRIGELPKLQFLLLSANNLTGGIPTSISNIQTLLRFAGNQNQFGGNLPAGITRYLKSLDLSYNKLNGTIPQDLLSQPNLQAVDLSFNQLEGQLPANISSSLVRLRLGGNFLNGTLPSASFGNSLNLSYLELDNNNFSGALPLELGFCSKLALLNLARNRLSGVLPSVLGNLTNLQGLYLQQNDLVGMIPGNFAHLQRLQRLNLSSNSINGSIPESIAKLTNLTNLDLGWNNLSGSIPNSIGSLNLLLELQLGNNQLSGNIPTLPTSLQIALNLSNNLFRGPIPATLSRLTALEVLDLSNNQFSGEIPLFLTSMGGLTQVVLSNNQLSGVVPKFGTFVTVVTGGNKDLKNTTNASPIKRREPKVLRIHVVVISIFGGLLFGIVLVKIILSVSRYSSRTKCQWIIEDSIHRSSFNISKAIEGVGKSRNIMLKREFCTYYKASMPSGMNYCIKKLYWSCEELTLLTPEEFAQKIEHTGKLSNPNIMSPLAYAFTSHTAFIVYEWPPQGTLYNLLHGSDENFVTWENRYKIAVGVSIALASAHCFHPSGAQVVLLHLSTKSIFMKSISEPLIGEFELHRLVNPSQQIGTPSIVAGDVGYIPPEYAYTMRITASGNIYSFGTILLELVTGKQAINEGMELVKWVVSRSNEQGQFEDILDRRVSTTSEEVQQQMMSMLEIAMCCVSASPQERPGAQELQAILLRLAQ